MCKVTISAYSFLKQFPDERTARLHIEGKRWAGHPPCPHCASIDRIQKRKVEGYYRCLTCKKDFTVRTGTIFERSHVPLDKWLYAIYLLVTARKGISSLQLSKEIGVTQKTAWFMLQRMREAYGAAKGGYGGGGFELLSGIIEIDETYIGGKETNKHDSKKLKAGRGAVGKSIVLGMAERGGRVIGRVIGGTDARTIQAAIRAQVESGSTLCTDEHAAYRGMSEHAHRVVNHSAKQFVDGMAHTNGIESVWALLKRGFYGTYHQFSRKHLQRYVDEFSFRLNEGSCKVHTLDRIDAFIQRSAGARLSYAELIS